MSRIFLFFSVCLLGFAVTPATSSDSVKGTPDRNTPADLASAWLRFHEADLCQGLDAEFMVTGSGVEVSGVIQDQRSYERLEEMLQPLRNSRKVEIHLTPPEEEKMPDEKRDPPASLWENYELRSFLGDPSARARERPDFEEQSQVFVPPPDDLLKQRLYIYAEQTLAWNRRIERYAKDLPALTRVALDPGMPRAFRLRASAVCRAHAQNMERIIGKLNANLEPAFPHSSKQERGAGPQKPEVPQGSTVERADQIAEYAQSVALRVYQFIHPEHYTVGLDELRQPSLLESLRTLQKMDSEFQRALAEAK